MTGIDDLRAGLAERLRELAAKHEVVGASTAVVQGDEMVQAVSGVTNLRTGVEVTRDTLFQIGSITKSYTATLVMQLVDEGLVDLDVPVQRYLPSFRTADEAATAGVTVRRLLAHTSGMDGDVFDDFGRGDECIERYVDAMASLAHTHPPGSFFSYCNSGYVLLGRLVEHFRGCSWDVALRKHLLDPLGAHDTVTLPEEAILRRTAVGHLRTGEDGALQVTPLWHLARATGPAGAISAPAAEVLAFARMLLDDGNGPGGDRVLTATSTQAMRRFEVEMPDPYTLGDAWGLGVILYRAASPLVFGHDGTTLGQNAFLRIVPDANLAMVLLCNGGDSGALFDDLVRPVLADLAGAELNPAAVPPATPPQVDPRSFVGSYERTGVRIDITADADGRLWFKATSTGPLAGTLPDEPPKQVIALDDSTLLTSEPDRRLGRHVTIKFLESSADGYRYVHAGARATPRVS
ncbi:MAG TPA: serine hydrolase domain-containing protein [Acidimicrobiales bacterium]|nr:serine hydrolase domain-containing protein [Acidimicrobiales bacterium]